MTVLSIHERAKNLLQFIQSCDDLLVQKKKEWGHRKNHFDPSFCERMITMFKTEVNLAKQRAFAELRKIDEAMAEESRKEKA